MSHTFGIFFVAGILGTLVVVLFFPRALHAILSGSFNNPKLTDHELDKLPLQSERELKELDLPPAISWEKFKAAPDRVPERPMDDGKGLLAYIMSGFNSNMPKLPKQVNQSRGATREG